MSLFKKFFFVLLVTAAPWPSWGPKAWATEPRAAVQDGAVPRAQVLVVARVARRVARQQPRVEALADWLARRMTHVGIRAGAALIARSPREMIDFLRTGRVDVVSETVLSALAYEEKAGAEILFHEWRSGRPYYRTVFITRRDAKIFSLDDLQGRRIAFEDRGSTSGFLLPMAVMLKSGLKMLPLDNINQPVPAGHVGYVFAQNEVNISVWTARGLVDAGAYSDDDWRRKKYNPKRTRDRLRVFFETKPLLRSTLLVRKGLPVRVKAALVDVLGKFGTTPGNRKVRRAYYNVERFARIEGRTKKSLEAARKIYRTINQLLN